MAEPDSSMNIGISAKLQDDGLEDPNIINTAVFYSITSTQKGMLRLELKYIINKTIFCKLFSLIIILMYLCISMSQPLNKDENKI